MKRLRKIFGRNCLGVGQVLESTRRLIRRLCILLITKRMSLFLRHPFSLESGLMGRKRECYSKTTCLAHFISLVCENGATSLLTTLSFVGLEGDLERNLAFRARNSDPLAQPDYYKVLYAYHVSKGDYRSGAFLSSPLSPRTRC